MAACGDIHHQECLVRMQGRSLRGRPRIVVPILVWGGDGGTALHDAGHPAGTKSRVRSQRAAVCSCTNRNAAAIIARDCAVSLNPSNP
jgi:hypothetical protein